MFRHLDAVRLNDADILEDVEEVQGWKPSDDMTKEAKKEFEEHVQAGKELEAKLTCPDIVKDMTVVLDNITKATHAHCKEEACTLEELDADQVVALESEAIGLAAAADKMTCLPTVMADEEVQGKLTTFQQGAVKLGDGLADRKRFDLNDVLSKNCPCEECRVSKHHTFGFKCLLKKPDDPSSPEFTCQKPVKRNWKLRFFRRYKYKSHCRDVTAEDAA